MSESQSSKVKEEPSGSAVERARAYGIDISLLEANLALRPGERALRHDAQVREIVKLQRHLRTNSTI